MKQFRQQARASISATLIALILFGVNADQVLGKGGARTGLKLPAGKSARPALAPVSAARRANLSTNDLANRYHAIRPDSDAFTEGLTVRRAEGFAVDLGTSEKIRFAPRRISRRARH